MPAYGFLHHPDLHHLKMFASKRSSLRFDTNFQWLPEVEVLLQNNMVVITDVPII
jgi:hypothetical protein